MLQSYTAEKDSFMIQEVRLYNCYDLNGNCYTAVYLISLYFSAGKNPLVWLVKTPGHSSFLITGEANFSFIWKMINSRRTFSSQIIPASSKEKIVNSVYFDKIPQTPNI